MVSFINPLSRSHATLIHFLVNNIIYIHCPFIQRSIKSNINTYLVFHGLLGPYSYIYKLGETGCYNPLPLKGTSSSMFYLSTCFVCTKVNKNGYACFMASSISHVASSRTKCFHYTLTCAMVQFMSEVFFLSNMN
jgi:hypothetical protein